MEQDNQIPICSDHKEATQYYLDSAFGMGPDMGLPLLDGLEYQDADGNVYVSVYGETVEGSWVERK